MSRVVATFGGREESQGGRDQRVDVIEAARPRRSQEGFQFSEREFDRIEVGTVGWEKSELRAEAVKKALAADGVDSHRIEARGFGAGNLRIPTAANVTEPRNRRIEIDFAPRVKG